jgi:hypothetical protein
MRYYFLVGKDDEGEPRLFTGGLPDGRAVVVLFEDVGDEVMEAIATEAHSDFPCFAKWAGVP